MTVTRLAWHPREHARTLDVVDDRVLEEGALQPRLVPLRVHEGGVHGPVKELLVEQVAVDVLQNGSTQNRMFGPENGDWSAVWIFVFSSIICACHRSRKKKIREMLPKIIMAALPEFGCLLSDPGNALPEFFEKEDSRW